ncbi:uncharacterized protein LOC113330913 [Papaver somniferum]|uniref:uncharacterized protein LOC113330913 n=1 Tax=Papaver somniferum TaxID=3469 RepID=UPI000E704FB2|nr:uncharacterized protein LOC113330913 [Papaver somniferum]
MSYVFGKPDEDVYDREYNDNKCLYYIEYNDNEEWNHVKPIRRKVTIKLTSGRYYICIGSFNGLICIYGSQLTYTDAPAMIINPVTKEYVVLPGFDSYPEYYETKGENSIAYDHLASGFGYLAETNEYKVVRIYKCWAEPTVAEVEVYTVGSGKRWRHVGKFDFGFSFHTHCNDTHGVFLNGCLHWRNTDGGMVVVFDLVDEKFRDHITPPPILTDTDDVDDTDGFILIGVSGGGILYYAVCQFIDGENFEDIWLFMKKNDNFETEEHQSWGWIKVPSLDQREPFAFMENGAAIRYDQGSVKWFLSETSTFEGCVTFDNISRQAFPYQHTLVSLKELGEEDAEIME